jgi:uncharacterized Zn finger protein
MPVIGCDGEQGGVCKEIWVDRGAAGPLSRTRRRRQARAAPMPLCNVRGKKGVVEVASITGAQFKNAPTLKSYDQITLAKRTRSSPTSVPVSCMPRRTGRSPSVSEFDFEPVPGLPEEPPRRESLRWQGAPRGALSPCGRCTSARSPSISAC